MPGMRPPIPIVIFGSVALVTSFGAHVVAVSLPAYVEQVGVGTAGTFQEIGGMLGPLLIGLVSEAFGLAAGFAACGILGLLAVGLVSQRAARPLAAAA
jgi:hypothetical protein